MPTSGSARHTPSRAMIDLHSPTEHACNPTQAGSASSCVVSSSSSPAGQSSLTATLPLPASLRTTLVFRYSSFPGLVGNFGTRPKSSNYPKSISTPVVLVQRMKFRSQSRLLGGANSSLGSSKLFIQRLEALPLSLVVQHRYFVTVVFRSVFAKIPTLVQPSSPLPPDHLSNCMY